MRDAFFGGFFEGRYDYRCQQAANPSEPGCWAGKITHHIENGIALTTFVWLILHDAAAPVSDGSAAAFGRIHSNNRAWALREGFRRIRRAICLIVCVVPFRDRAAMSSFSKANLPDRKEPPPHVGAYRTCEITCHLISKHALS